MVISEARARGGTTQVLEKAAVSGAGGGRGPTIGGLQPSYKVTGLIHTSTGVSQVLHCRPLTLLQWSCLTTSQSLQLHLPTLRGEWASHGSSSFCGTVENLVDN